MTVIKEIEINDFYDLKQLCWSGACSTLSIVEELGLEEEFFNYVESMLECEEKITDTLVNDFIWFDCDDWLKDHEDDDE